MAKKRSLKHLEEISIELLQRSMEITDIAHNNPHVAAILIRARGHLNSAIMVLGQVDEEEALKKVAARAAARSKGCAEGQKTFLDQVTAEEEELL